MHRSFAGLSAANGSTPYEVPSLAEEAEERRCFGLNSRQIEIVATAQPKRDYYYQSRLGNRVFELGLGPVALAFAGAASPEDQRELDRVQASVLASPFARMPSVFAAAWLRHRGLGWAADLIPSFPSAFPPLSSTPQEPMP